MKITGIETFVVDTGFAPRRPWLFSAVRTDAGVTGDGEFGCDGLELALWDLASKALGVPVYRLMGGPHRERQRAWTG